MAGPLWNTRSRRPGFMRGAEVFVSGLIASGLDAVFALPGAQTCMLFDTLRKRADEITTCCSRRNRARPPCTWSPVNIWLGNRC